MSQNAKATIGALVIVVGALLITVYIGVFKGELTFSGAGGVSARECTVTHSVAIIGDDISSTVLSEYTNRAWAVVKQPLNATNTVALSFDEGAAAVLTGGYGLTNATTTSPASQSPFFGLNSDFSYTGAVTGITSTGSTTVLVTECRY